MSESKKIHFVRNSCAYRVKVRRRQRKIKTHMYNVHIVEVGVFL